MKEIEILSFILHILHFWLIRVYVSIMKLLIDFYRTES